jgi:hypothetical protein
LRGAFFCDEAISSLQFGDCFAEFILRYRRARNDSLSSTFWKALLTNPLRPRTFDHFDLDHIPTAFTRRQMG